MTARFVAVHPVLAAFDVEASIRFYEALGFVASHEGMKLRL